MGTDRFTDELDSEHSSVGPGDQVLNSDRTGIIPRAVHTIFNKIQQQTTKSNQINLKTSYVEIYNEDLIDLIACSTAPANTLPQVTIREDKDGKIIWSGLKEVKVTKASEALSLLEQGSQVRQTNSTEMNAQSSRSHAIFSLNLTQSKLSGTSSTNSSNKRASKILSPTSSNGRDFGDDGEWSTISSKFHFVDLAGSERLKRTAAVAERVKEGISINVSLVLISYLPHPISIHPYFIRLYALILTPSGSPPTVLLLPSLGRFTRTGQRHLSSRRS
jgi:kinesin family protein 4/21/27